MSQEYNMTIAENEPFEMGTAHESEPLKMEFDQQDKPLEVEFDHIDLVNAVSPRVTIEREGDHVNITIEDINGVHTATLPDGKDGANGKDGADGKNGVDGKDGADGKDGVDGVSPAVSVAKVGAITTVTVTDASGTTTANIIDGQTGAKGDTGVTPHLVIGIVQEGASAAASITGTDERPELNLTLPAANVPTKVSQLDNDIGFISSETDPTVPNWAKQAEKPSYTAAEVGALPDDTVIPTKVSDLTNDSGYYAKPPTGIPASDIASGVIPDVSGKLDSSLKGAANGLAELDIAGKVPSEQLPSYVDDVVEYSTRIDFPVDGESGKIYIATDSGIAYRWTGSTYAAIGSSLTLGETSSTAYRGDRGAAAYAHAVTNKGNAYTNGLYKITTNSEGHVIGAIAVVKKDITDLGVPGSAIDGVVKVQDAEPTTPDTTIWLPATAAQSIQIPTMNDFNSALALKIDIDAIAPLEATTAIAAHAIGDPFILGTKLYKATSAIAVGDSIVTSGASANCTSTTIVQLILNS